MPLGFQKHLKDMSRCRVSGRRENQVSREDDSELRLLYRKRCRDGDMDGDIDGAMAPCGAFSRLKPVYQNSDWSSSIKVTATERESTPRCCVCCGGSFKILHASREM